MVLKGSQKVINFLSYVKISSAPFKFWIHRCMEKNHALQKMLPHYNLCCCYQQLVSRGWATGRIIWLLQSMLMPNACYVMQSILCKQMVVVLLILVEEWAKLVGKTLWVMVVFVNNVGNLKKDKLMSMMKVDRKASLPPLLASFRELIRWSETNKGVKSLNFLKKFPDI